MRFQEKQLKEKREERVRTAESLSAESINGDGPVRRRLSRRGAVGALVVTFLAMTAITAAAPVSASYVHRSTYSFGTDGTSSTEAAGNALDYRQANNRLFALTTASPWYLYGWTFNSPGSAVTPLSGFPFEVQEGYSGGSDIAVDNTALNTAGNIYYTPAYFEKHVVGYAPDGTPLGGFSLDEEGNTVCGLAVDNQGRIWAAISLGDKIERFSSSGGSPNLSIDTGYNACKIEIDQATNDLYVGDSQGLVHRYTAASNYDPAQEVRFDTGTGFWQTTVAINPTKGILYAATQFGKVDVFSTATGSLLEEFGGCCIQGIAVDNDTDTVFLSRNGVIEEWQGVNLPTPITGDPVGDKEVSGTVDPAGGGEITDCYFEYGEKTGPAITYTTKVDCEPATTFNAPANVTADIPALESEKTYNYRLVAENAFGPERGGNKTITPHWVPNLKTEPATSITRETATLNGSFDGNGQPTHYYFEYGTSTGYGTKTAVPPGDSAGAPNGPATVSTPISGLTAGVTYHYRVVAENEDGESKGQDQVFTSAPAVKDLTTEAATEVKPTTAILNGSLDPDTFATSYYFEWGKTTNYGQATPLPPGDPVGTTTPGTAHVSAMLENLEPGTTYHYRIVATNNFGTSYGGDETVATPHAPSVNSFSSTNVTASTADLVATLNPNGAETTYYFEYGTTLDYGNVAPVPAGTLPAVSTTENVVVPIENLQDNTYHFRLIAESQWGRVVTEDQTFDFNAPRSCPNHTVRQQTGSAYLPDCRAYEIVSAERAGGAILKPEGPVSNYASNPGRFSYGGLLNAIPGSGEPINAGLAYGDLYIASRTVTGWKTKYVGMPGWKSLRYGGEPTGEYGAVGFGGGPGAIDTVLSDRGMNRFLIWDGRTNGLFGGELSGTDAPYVLDNEGNFVGRLPSGIEDMPGGETDVTEGGFVGTARVDPELTTYAFSSIKMAFTGDGLTEPVGSAYVDDVQSGDITLISKTEGGQDIPKDPNSGVSDEFIRLPAMSDDGTHVLMSTGGANGTVHLYLRDVDQGASYEVSADESSVNQGVKFEGMTSDGSRVYYSTNKQMTTDDTDTSIDLYMWDEATNSSTRISDSGNLAGNTDACSASWNGGKCNIQVVPVTPKENKRFDSAMAIDNGAIYFYSPELLDGARGLPNKRNLYVYRDGVLQHVATLDPNGAASRINVSPDGRKMALITTSRLTAYDNAGKAMMYRYDADSRAVQCVSCLPSGAPPTADVEGSTHGLFMTFDGRAFFATAEALVPQDANGIQDVYEFVDGRPQLISSGTGDNPGNPFVPIGLVGVSGDGVDAFFATYETLVRQDENGEQLKFYDARTSGGFQVDKPPAPCVAADECHGMEAAGAPSPQLGTTADLGDRGNVASDKPKGRKRCRKLHGKRKQRCLKKAGTGHKRSHRHG
jgi:hypothetical protein